MHGNEPGNIGRSPYFGPCRLVAILHSRWREGLSDGGFGLAEAMVALLVLCVGLLGVASVAHSSRRLAELAATRTAQTIAVRRVLDPAGSSRPAGGPATVTVGRRRLAVWLDTTRIGERLVELRLIVKGGSAAGDLEVVTRRSVPP